MARAQFKQQNIEAEGQSKIATDINERVKNIHKDFEEKLKPYEEFHPTKDNWQDLAAMFALTAFAGSATGGGGGYSGMMALNNMAGAMQGYQQGRKDLFDKEMKEWKANMESNKAFNEQQATLLKNAMDALPYDRAQAEALLKEAAAKESGGVLDAMIRKGQYEQAFKFSQIGRAHV